MQLQSIDQVYEGQTVFHPVYGECEVLATNPDYGVKVNTPKLDQYEIFRPEELYTEPVTVIAESELKRLNELVHIQKSFINQITGYVSYDLRNSDSYKYCQNKISKLEKTDK